MTGLLHQVLSGLASGAIYASLALALVVAYRASGQVNFAAGELATLSTYGAATLLGAGAPYWAAFVVAVAGAAAVGAAAERVLLRPLPSGTAVGATVGLLLLVNAATGAVWGTQVRAFPSPFGNGSLLAGSLSRHEAGTLLTVAAAMAATALLFRRTGLGLGMRAAAADAEAGQLVGLAVGRLRSLGWALSGALGAVAGLLVAPVVFLDPSMMSGVLLYAFAGAVLGGLDSPVGAVAGSLAVGVAENLLGAYLVGTELKQAVALGVIAATLVLRPRGLFGPARA